MNDDVPHMITAEDADADLCTDGGAVDHDYRRVDYIDPLGSPQSVLRCVWCHVVACGDTDNVDPCIEPYHHTVPHRAKSGLYWPLGATQPSPRNRPR